MSLANLPSGSAWSGFYWPKSAEWSLLLFEGRDARAFLNRMTTLNMEALQAQQGNPGLFLNAQGKIEAAFTLHQPDPNVSQYYFECPGAAWMERLRTIIDTYTFAEEQALREVPTDWEGLWHFGGHGGETDSAVPEALSNVPQGLITLRESTASFESPWTSLWGPRHLLERWIENRRSLDPLYTQLTLDFLHTARIQSGTPWFGSEILPSVSQPLELGMQAWISDQKGCYPGQEVIERIRSIGSPAKRLCQIQFDQEPTFKCPVESDRGTLTSLQGRLGLAIVKKIFATSGSSLQFGPFEGVIQKVISA